MEIKSEANSPLQYEILELRDKRNIGTISDEKISITIDNTRINVLSYLGFEEKKFKRLKVNKLKSKRLF
jgi:hypothetical protein